MIPATLDFASQSDYVWALLPEIVLTVSAIAVLLVDVAQRGADSGPSRPMVGRLAMAGVVAAAVANGWLLGTEAVGGGGLVALDALRVASNWIVLGGTLLGLLFARDYLRREDLDRGEFYALVLFSATGMMVLVGGRDLIVMFLGLETMSIAAYVLTAFNRRDPRSSEAGLKYFLVGAFASAFFVYGVSLLYGATGTTHLAEMTPSLGRALEGGDLVAAGGVGLLLIGFGFKVSAVPFHMWAPDAYQGAPTPVTGWMAAAVKAAGFLALLRVLAVHLEVARGVWEGIVWWLAVLTMIVPNLVALVQDDVKRMLAYSSVGHAGYVLVGVAVGGVAGTSAAVFYLAVYTLMTLGAFGVTYLAAGKGDRRSHLADFRGLGWERPALGATMALFLLSLAGFPPTGGFVAKLFVIRSAVEGGQVVLAVTLVLTSLVAYYYYLRVVWKMYFEEAPEGTVLPERAGRSFRTAAAVCVVGVLAAGVFPGPGLEGASRAASAAVATTPGSAPVDGGPSAPGRAASPERPEDTGDGAAEPEGDDGARGGGARGQTAPGGS